MKFRCERDVLVEALGAAARAVTNRGGALPVLSGIRAEVAGSALRLTGTDLDLTIEVEIAVSGESDGACVLHWLAPDIVRSFEPGAVTVTVTEDEAQIASGRSQFSLRGHPVEEFPRVAPAAGEALSLGAVELADALRQVVPAASHDDARPILTGVLLAAEADGLRLVATDSYRLAVRDLPGTSVLREGQAVLVPSRALGELGRLLSGATEVQLRLGDKEATFEVGATRLTTRLIEGEYPPYRNLIPASYPNRLTVGKEPFLDALKRVKLLARELSTPVRLSLKAGGLELTASTNDVGQAHEDLDAKYEGAEMVVAFNPEFLITGVEAATGDEVTLETLDALKPATLRGTERQDFLYLLMPVRVS